MAVQVIEPGAPASTRTVTFRASSKECAMAWTMSDRVKRR